MIFRKEGNTKYAKDFCWRELLSRQKRLRVRTQSSVQVNVLKISEKIKIHEQNKLEIYIYQSFFLLLFPLNI